VGGRQETAETGRSGRKGEKEASKKGALLRTRLLEEDTGKMASFTWKETYKGKKTSKEKQKEKTITAWCSQLLQDKARKGGGLKTA